MEKKFTAYTMEELETVSTEEWGYEPGEMVEMAKEGEQTLGGKFLGMDDESEDDFVFVFEVDGKVKAYTCVGEPEGLRWFEQEDDEEVLAAFEAEVAKQSQFFEVKVTGEVDDTNYKLTIDKGEGGKTSMDFDLEEVLDDIRNLGTLDAAESYYNRVCDMGEDEEE